MAIKFPTTSEQLRDYGWIYDDEGTCRECGEIVEFWINPEGDPVSLDVIETATIQHATGQVRQLHICE